jgi:hypothetical protein
MKIKLKGEQSINDYGVIKGGVKGDVIEVTDSIGLWEIAAGRASEHVEEPKKKD